MTSSESYVLTTEARGTGTDYDLPFRGLSRYQQNGKKRSGDGRRDLCSGKPREQ
jgi:hypothetical protein